MFCLTTDRRSILPDSFILAIITIHVIITATNTTASFPLSALAYRNRRDTHERLGIRIVVIAAATAWHLRFENPRVSPWAPIPTMAFSYFDGLKLQFFIVRERKAQSDSFEMRAGKRALIAVSV